MDTNGELLIKTSIGEVRQKAPIAYQVVDGEKQKVASRYRLLPGRQVAFDLGGYDPKRELVIDPVLRYSTFLGGDEDDYGFGIALDTDNDRVIFSDENRHSLLVYERTAGGSSNDVTEPVTWIFGPRTQLGYIAGVEVDRSPDCGRSS